MVSRGGKRLTAGLGGHFGAAHRSASTRGDSFAPSRRASDNPLFTAGSGLKLDELRRRAAIDVAAAIGLVAALTALAALSLLQPLRAVLAF